MTEIRPVIFVPLERSISYASYVMPWIVGLAGQGIPWIHVPYGPTDVSRNEAVKEFMKTEGTHLLMLDLDHIHPLDIVYRLGRHFVDRNVEVVGGLNFSRKPPHLPCCGINKNGGWYHPDEWDDGLVEVDMLGAGSIMISRGVFERVRIPWFYKPVDRKRAKEGVWLSDDVGFSRKCKAAGVRLFVDTTVSSPHIVVKLVNEETYKAYRELEWQ